MALTLVTGPANAEKAGVVLERVRELARDGASPLLIVPTFADVEAYRRELAATGVVFGAQVVTFARLSAQIALVAHAGRPPLGTLGRRRVAAAAVARTPLSALERAAGTAGFAPALVGLFDEFAEQRLGTGLVINAMRAWGEAEPRRAAFASELAALHAAYRDWLERLGRTDPPGHAYAAHDALRLAPALWGGVPVLLYGFDDLTRVELDAVATLAGTCAEVVVSLPYEDGREDIYRTRAETLGELSVLQDRWIRLPEREEHYEPQARAPLHALERRLFSAPAERADPGDALVLLEGGGERAELELVAEQVARALADGVAPGDIAVAIRDAGRIAPLIERIFADADIPIALERRIPLAHTSLGHGLVAMLRAALPGGTAEDLLGWLRAPGVLQQPDLADSLEERVRRTGIRDAAGAHDAWAELAGFRWTQLERVGEAAARGIPALCERLTAEARRLLAAPWRQRGALLVGAPQTDAYALRAVRTTLRELAALAEADTALAPEPEELADILADEEVRLGDTPHPGAVTIADPLRLRARRVRVLVLARMQEGVFPTGAAPDPFLGDAERLALAAAGKIRLRLREDPLDAERWLLYSAISRPTLRLALAWHTGDDDGDPRVRSLFVDDVLECFTEGVPLRTRRLGELAWAPGDAVSARQRALAEAAARPAAAPAGGPGDLTDGEILADLAARPAWAGRAIEQWLSCPVKWFVEQHLHPNAIEPDPVAMARGTLYHRVLEQVLRGLGGRVTPQNVHQAERIAAEALAAGARERRLGASEQQHDALVRRLEVDVLRHLRFAASNGSVFEPAALELSFGTPYDERDPVEIAPGLRLSGRIDRVDVHGDEAIVVDYKGVTGSQPYVKWAAKNQVQAALYALALPQLLEGRRVVGALYQPIGARKDQRPRGFLLDDADPDRTDIVATDRVDEAGAGDALEEVRSLATSAIEALLAGRLEPRPLTCAYRGGCSHPSICRCADA
ncbi:MAG TPA: PD-(D/E)XK nuclease family protein [Solirubrobacteraceae bacterium]